MIISFVRTPFRVAVAAAALLAVSPQTTPSARADAAEHRSALPDKLSDAEFWKIVTDLSEPDDYFRIVDNFTSNEGEIAQVFTMLRDTKVQGDVYLGVGPEQNLTYIAAVRPQMAFICDIRRQAVVQHLMYKAMFEMSKDRADFISLLFGIPRPDGLDSTTEIGRIWGAFDGAARDTVLQNRNYTRVVDRITKTHGFTLTQDETIKLNKVFYAFQEYGPRITTQSGSGGRAGFGGGFGGLTFESLTGDRTDNAGKVQSFLSTEDNFRFVKSLEDRNLLIPISGDFGKTKALRGIGAWIKDHGGIVRAFYVSNVESYLFQDGKNGTFYENVATFPVDSASVFIRPYSMRGGRGGGGYFGTPRPLCPIAAFERLFKADSVRSYAEALACAVGK
ncbi:MAG TPA: hypothetical protein VE967_17920 [Gemmatimonadaceae bacterium]|nr:hypothetical protein [Gemmatimonadaceae bacterium]